MNIFISNLSFDVDDQDLKELFEEYGQISSAKVIIDRMTGKSRGFGFVEMPTEEQAQKAIEDLNQVEYDGKVINVSIAKPKTENSNRGGGNFGGRRSGGFGGGERRGGFNDRRGGGNRY